LLHSAQDLLFGEGKIEDNCVWRLNIGLGFPHTRCFCGTEFRRAFYRVQQSGTHFPRRIKADTEKVLGKKGFHPLGNSGKESGAFFGGDINVGTQRDICQVSEKRKFSGKHQATAIIDQKPVFLPAMGGFKVSPERGLEESSRKTGLPGRVFRGHVRFERYDSRGSHPD
jgi:hypothetical protein